MILAQLSERAAAESRKCCAMSTRKRHHPRAPLATAGCRVQARFRGCGGCYITFLGLGARLRAEKQCVLGLTLEGSGRRQFGGVQPRYIKWCMGCCVLERGDTLAV